MRQRLSSPSASHARKVFCRSRMCCLANSEYHAIELVSRSCRVRPHATLQRAGTLAPAWYDSTAAMESPVTNLNACAGMRCSGMRGVFKVFCTCKCEVHALAAAWRPGAIVPTSHELAKPMASFVKCVVNFRRARHRLAGITFDRRTASVIHAACTDKVQQLPSTVVGWLEAVAVALLLAQSTSTLLLHAFVLCVVSLHGASSAPIEACER